ncbi:MAG: hypothetical protein WC785_02345 [Tatlockia sp.]|jgi:hypothetical protein
MPHNQYVTSLLNHPMLSITNEEGKNALEALIQADSRNVDAMMAAFSGEDRVNEAYWNGLIPYVAEEGEDFLLVEEGLAALHRLAVEKRIVLGLKGASIQNLTAIAQADNATLRLLLTEDALKLVVSDLTTIPTWDNGNLLTDSMLAGIKHEANQLRLQKENEAMDAAFQLKTEENSQFKAVAHPALFELIKQLSLAKQKALLENDEVFNALLEAQDVAAIKQLVRDNHIEAPALVALVNENKRLANFAKIYNAEVAAILAEFRPPIDLDNKKTNKINMFLMDIVDEDEDEQENDEKYIANVGKILGHIGKNQIGLASAFGLNDNDPAEILNHDLKNNIIAQSTRNDALINLPYDKNNKAAEALRKVCLNLPKSELFTVADFNAMQDDLKQTTSLAAFIAKAEARDYAQHLQQEPSWTRHITQKNYDEVKSKLNQQNFRSPEGYQEALTAQKAKTDALRHLLKKMRDSNVGIHSKLTAIGKTSDINWLNPAFQIAVKQYLTEMKKESNELATICDAFLTQCDTQIAVLKAELASLPGKEEPLPKAQRQAIEKRRQELEDHWREVNKLRALYEPAQKFLHGNPEKSSPLMKQGVLKTLEQFEEGKEIDFLLPSMTTVRIPNEKKPAYLKGQYLPDRPEVPDQEGQVGARRGDRAQRYGVRDKVQEGYFNEHSMSHRGHGGSPFVSRFIEEHDFTKEASGTYDNKGKVHYSPCMTVTAVKFPSEKLLEEGFTEEDLEEAKIECAMAMAVTMLGGMSKPTKENPIASFIGMKKPTIDNPITVLSHPDNRFIFMALNYIAENDPNMRFDKKAIQIDNTKYFSEDSFGKNMLVTRLRAKGYFGFGQDELYAKFDKNAGVKQTMAKIKAANRDKVHGAQKTIGEIREITGHFRTKVKARETLGEVEEKNRDDERPKLK